jgi:hypothetical protein
MRCSNGAPVTSIIRRMCCLISPEVPVQMKQKVFTVCLEALHSYIIGPIISGSNGTPCGGSVWHPDNMLTKQVVEFEKLPLILFKILDDNFTVTATNQELLRCVVRCVTVFSERHVACLEGMLRLGFRNKIVALLQQRLIEVPLIRSALATLAVLCGHTHSGGAALPNAMSLGAKEIFDILYTQHLILTTLMKTPHDRIDPHVLVNVFTVLRYVLPLCSPNDQLFQVIQLECLH